MSNVNQGNRQPTEWTQISQHKDQESGAIIIVKKSGHRPRPGVEFAIGSAHGKTGLFTPHNLIKYDNEKPFNEETIDKFFEGLERLKADLKASLKDTISGVQKALPKQRPQQHGRKPGEPGEPGKTGKTARKKAAKMGGAQKPAAQPEV